MTRQQSDEMKITHITGTFLIDAAGAFLNGHGLAPQEDKNFMKIKTFQDGSSNVPYVSSQAWRRWLRNTLIEENPDWEPSRIRALHKNPSRHTDKVGGEFNPVDFPEDDIFGYMRTAPKPSGKAEPEEGEEEDETSQQQQGSQVKAISRTSPFSSSILMSLRKLGWEGRDQAYVHLVEGSPVPYKIQFYSTSLQGIFCLNYKRLGVFTNIGDKIELDRVDEFVKSKKISEIEEQSKHAIYYSLEKNDTNEKANNPSTNDAAAKKTKQVFNQVKKTGNVYQLANVGDAKKKRASALLKALSRLRGGAKQAAFATDVSPKVLILAGLRCGNPIFNNLFEDNNSNSSSNRGRTVTLNVDALKEITKDYEDRICTPVFIGIRKGYLANEDIVRQLSGEGEKEEAQIQYKITTPIDAAEQMVKELNSMR